MDSDSLKPDQIHVSANEKRNVNRKPIHAMYLITVLNLTAMSLFSPLVNRQVGDLKVPSLTMGLVGSFYGLSTLISSPFIGSSSDRYGSRSVFILSLVATALNNFVQWSARSLIPFVVARGLAGFFKHTQTLGKIVLTEFISRQEIPQTFGYYNAFSNIGVIIGPAIGGRLIECQNGFEMICLLAVSIYVTQICIFVLIVLRSKPLEEPVESHCQYNNNENKTSSGSAISKEPRRRQLIRSIAAQFCFSFAVSCIRTNLPINLQTKYGTSISTISYLNSLQSLIGTLIGFAIGPVLTHIYKGNNRRMIIHAGAVEVIGFLCYYTSSSFAVGAVALLLVEVTNSFLIISTVALSLENGGRTSSILSLGRMASTLALMIAPTASGGVQSTVMGYGGPPLMSAGMAGVGILVALFSANRVQEKDKST